MNLTYVGEIPVDNNHAGNKARLDVDAILRERYGEPYQNLEQIVFKNFTNKITYVLNFSNLIRIWRVFRLQSECVIMQYPFYFNCLLKKALYYSLDKNNVIFIIHDIDSLRPKENTEGICVDIERLNKAVIVVVHNDIMAQKLKEVGLNVPCISLELFDYLLPGAPQKHLVKGKTIVFAGNLGKSKFLRCSEMEKLGLQFNLYGPNFRQDLIKWNNVVYKGSFTPEVIPFEIEGSFGLIWDGTGVVTCDGPTGEYMKYNNPHKLSLYIAAGIPVIVWSQAAVARFVEKYAIGIIVDSLFDIESKIESLSNQEYDKMITNIKMLQSKVIHGEFTKRCLNQIEEYISEHISEQSVV